MKVLVICIFQMSTSILVQNIKKAAAARGLTGVTVETAAAASVSRDLLGRYDVILLAPQVRYLLDDVKRKLGDLQRPIQVLDMVTFGQADGNKVLDLALQLAGQSPGGSEK